MAIGTDGNTSLSGNDADVSDENKLAIMKERIEKVRTQVHETAESTVLKDYGVHTIGTALQCPRNIAHMVSRTRIAAEIIDYISKIRLNSPHQMA